MTDDAALLRSFHVARSEQALGEFVQRHLNLVHGAALRRLCGNTHQAAEVTQLVFATVARNAAALSRHPNLVAWLHSATRNTALDLARGEQRRRRRETEALAMSIQNEDTESSGPDELEQLRGLLDELIDTLPAREREALLLRHLEDRPLADIARSQGISPDAARMRINRALDRLRAALGRRGLKSSGAALLGALAAEASTQVPAPLASQITTGCLSGAPGLGLGIATTTLLHMTSTKLAVLTAACLAVLSGSWALHEYQRRENLSNHLELTLKKEAGGRTQGLLLGQRSDELARKLAEASKDLSTLKAMAQPEATPEEELPITRSLVAKRLDKARSLEKSGRHKEALEEYLWCFDIGMIKVSEFSGVRSSYVIGEIMKMAEQYPAAREELVRRRDKALEDLVSGKGRNPDDLIYLNKALGDEAKTLLAYDALPADDKQRQTFRLFAFDLFARERRYEEAAQGHSLSFMNFTYESSLERLKDPRFNKSGTNEAREFLSKATETNIEVLAGIGDLANAGKLADRLLRDQVSPADRERIQNAFTRAGHPEVANTYKTP